MMRLRAWLQHFAARVLRPSHSRGANRSHHARQHAALSQIPLASETLEPRHLLTGEKANSPRMAIKLRSYRIMARFLKKELTDIHHRDYPVWEGFLPEKGIGAWRHRIPNGTQYPHFLDLARCAVCQGPTAICVGNFPRLALLKASPHPAESTAVALRAAGATLPPFCLPELAAGPSRISI